MTSNDSGQQSFRDPAGFVFEIDDRIIRIVTAADAAETIALLDSAWAKELVAAGKLIGTRNLDAGESERLRTRALRQDALYVLEHDVVDFVSYPYEWPAEMVWCAAELTVQLAGSLHERGWGLKDATPFNVLFRGPNPVFVDVMSFERRRPLDPIWLPYAQFTRMFLLPLLADRALGVPTSRSLSYGVNGIDPGEMSQQLGPLRRLQPRFLSLVTLPVWLGKLAGDRVPSAAPLRSPTAEQAQFVLRRTYSRLLRQLERVKPARVRNTQWTEYARECSYSAEAAADKSAFVEAALKRASPARVLDLGANTGQFSILAASAGADVVAVDNDPICIGRLWRSAREGQLSILPLVVDVVDPTPSRGWKSSERKSFLKRAAGKFDMVLALGLIHHLTTNERIPLREVLGLLADITTASAIVEYVPPEDAMVQRLLRGRDIPADVATASAFESECAGFFAIESRREVTGSGRILYSLKRLC